LVSRIDERAAGSQPARAGGLSDKAGGRSGLPDAMIRDGPDAA
jgi:hypothetical protein